ncbi:MAG: hypothetical protein H6696_11310 [Deferribacteres bacterium]|nr:hypothetical protein [candidate division KSB1 bacterium]MCB9502518.1 hypothetical protein [Deferribacteres bacterium]
MKKLKLNALIKRICTEQYSQDDLTQFVNLVQKISLSYLKYQEVIGKNIRWENTEHGTELEDMALDCVAGLFMRNENNEFIQLKRYFEPFLEYQENLENAEVMILLRRLIIKKTKQELSRIFKERDPEGAKIIRNIRVAVKNGDTFGTFREMGREYIFNQPRTDYLPQGVTNTLVETEIDQESFLRKDKPTIPEKVLRSHYLEVYNPKDHVSTSIRKMLSAVETDDDFQKCLPMDLIARLIRQTSLEMARTRLMAQFEEDSPLDYVRMKEIEQAKKKVLTRVRAKVFSQYVDSGKIEPEKGEIYYKTLNDVLDDITHNKKIESYYRHLQKYLPNLTQKRYRAEERTIFEYLGKLTKKWFREYLKDLL